MSLPPSEIPLGAMRFNSDSQKLEYWMGSAWMQIQTFTPNLNGGARGFWLAGSFYSPQSPINIIEFVTISTQGNGTDFGDTSEKWKYNMGCASNTRGVSGGGVYSDSGTYMNTIEFITMSSSGDAVNFGDLVSDNKIY